MLRIVFQGISGSHLRKLERDGARLGSGDGTLPTSGTVRDPGAPRGIGGLRTGNSVHGSHSTPPWDSCRKSSKKKARNGEKAQPAHRPQMHPSRGRSPQCRIWGFPAQSGAEDPQPPTHTSPDTSTANLRPAAFIFRGGQMIWRGAAFLCFLIRRLFLSPATRPPRTPIAAPKR